MSQNLTDESQKYVFDTLSPSLRERIKGRKAILQRMCNMPMPHS